MQHRRLGRTGLKVSEICLGTMTFGRQCDEATSRAIMDAAFEGGVAFFDSADVYPTGGFLEMMGRSEEIIGRWLKGRRDKVVIATKCHGATGTGQNDRGLSRAHIISAVEGSLRRLQTDHIDLYQAHSPDPETPVEETLRAFDDLIRQGKVRYIGGSNHQAWHFGKSLLVSQKHGLARLDSAQIRYNILFRENESEVLPFCRDQGLGVLVNNSLAAGVLTGKYTWDAPPPPGSRMEDLPKNTMPSEIFKARYWHEDHIKAVDTLKAYFQSRGKEMAQVAIAWVLAQPGITSAIVGASSAAQFKQSLGATAVQLEKEEMAACNAIWPELPRLRHEMVARI